MVALRNMIANGELSPGEHLRQDEVAQRIGTTRVPVREAFKTLTAEGMLVHRRNHGHFVAMLTSQELRQLFWLRETIEDELVRTARWPDARTIAYFRRLNDQIRDSMLQKSTREIIEIDRVLHFALWDLSPQRVLQEELARIWRLTEPYKIFNPYYEPPRIEHSLAEHDAIIDALEHEDRSMYKHLLTEHRSSVLRAIDHLNKREHQEPQAVDPAAAPQKS